MKLHGTVRYRDLEGGLWVFESDDGQTFQLAGGDRKLKHDGGKATVEGDVQQDAVTLGMVGPVLKVTSYRFD